MKKTILKLMAIATVFSISLCSCNIADSKKTESNVYTSSENPIEAFTDYFDAFFSSDTESLLLITTPAAYLEEMKVNGTYNTLVTQTQDIMIKYTLDTFKEQYGDDVSISLKEQLNSVPLSQEQLEDALHCYKTNYGTYSSNINIVEGYEITYTYTISGSKASDEKSEAACFVKIENDCWKMMPVTAETLSEYKKAQNMLLNQ